MQAMTKSTHLSDRVPNGISVRDYVDVRFDEAQRTIDKTETMINARLTSMNEFRDQLKDQAMRFITREEINISFDSLKTELRSSHKLVCDDIRELQKTADESRGKASQSALIFTALMSLAGLILGLIHIFAGK